MRRVLFLLAAGTLCAGATRVPAAQTIKPCFTLVEVISIIVVLFFALSMGILAPLAPLAILSVRGPSNVLHTYRAPDKVGRLMEITAQHSRLSPIHDDVAIRARFPVQKKIDGWFSPAVWTSTDVKTEKKMVIKESYDIFYEQVQAELRAMRYLAENPHPALRPRDNIFVGRGHYYVASEYIEGVTITQMRSLGAGEIACLLWDGARALQHLHEKVRLAHGDLHTGNMMVDLQGRLHLIDFSFSREIRHRSATTFDLKSMVSGMLGFYNGQDREMLDRMYQDINNDIIMTASDLVNLIAELFPNPEQYRERVAARAKKVYSENN